MKTGCVFNWFHIGEDAIGGKEAVHNVRMEDCGFANRFQMNRTDFIAVDLRKDLPVGCTEGFPLDSDALWAVTDPLGFSGTVPVQGQEEPVC